MSVSVSVSNLHLSPLICISLSRSCSSPWVPSWTVCMTHSPVSWRKCVLPLARDWLLVLLLEDGRTEADDRTAEADGGFCLVHLSESCPCLSLGTMAVPGHTLVRSFPTSQTSFHSEMSPRVASGLGPESQVGTSPGITCSGDTGSRNRFSHVSAQSVVQCKGHIWVKGTLPGEGRQLATQAGPLKVAVTLMN